MYLVMRQDVDGEVLVSALALSSSATGDLSEAILRDLAKRFPNDGRQAVDERAAALSALYAKHCSEYKLVAA